MNNIFQTLLYQREKQKDTVLATIVWDDGSAPRGAGSQMLVGAEGLLSGTIGGGAVELRSIQLARALLAGQHVDALYDFKLSRDGELGMACGGDVTVLFTPARLSDRVWDALAAEVLRCVRDRVPGWLVLPLDGAAPHIAETAETGEGVFSLPLPVGERAVIFGAGHIARALTPLLRTIGFRPVVVDDRPGFATAEHFPQADRTICGDFDRISDYLTLTPEDYVVIMTNGHEHDFQAEVQVLRGETAYVGVIGSRKKTAFVNQRLREAGIPEEKIAFVHTPVGTPIKAVTPEEIAVSIAAELVWERARRGPAAAPPAAGEPGVLCTITAKRGSAPRGVGTWMLVRPDGSVLGTIGGGAVEHLAVQEAKALWAHGGGPVRRHYDLTPGAAELGMVCGGDIDVEFEVRKRKRSPCFF